MAGSKTDYLENKVLDAVLNNSSLVVATPYVALFTATPSDAGGGTEVSTSGTAYARAVSTTSWPAASGGSCANDVAIAFATATANWGTVSQFAIMDAATAGNMLYWGDLTTPRTINNGDPTPTFAIGALVITEQ